MPFVWMAESDVICRSSSSSAFTDSSICNNSPLCSFFFFWSTILSRIFLLFLRKKFATKR